MAEKNEKQEHENHEKNELPRDEYWALTSDFTQIVNRAKEGYQEKAPGREIDFVNLFMGSRSGIICKADERGIPQVIVSGEEIDNQGRKRTQRFFIGLQSGAATKDEAFLASNLAERETIVKEFEVSSHGHELVRSAVNEAQKAGERIQRKIDEENYEWFPLLHVKGEERSINEDYEPKVDLDLVVNLVASARQVIRQELGAKIKNVETVFLKWTENMEYADTDGAKIDHIIPRVAFSISVKTKDDSEAFGSLRGSMGTIDQVLRRYDGDGKERDLLEIVQELAREVAKEAIDLDRAQGASILGTECPVIFSSQAAGVLAHEIFGHPSESDIICHNRRSKIAKLTLKSRIGAQVSDHPAFSIIDTGQATTTLGAKQIKHAFGSLIVDEEGCPAKETKLVDKGIQINVLNDRYTFNEILDGLKEEIVEGMKKHGLTGNVRREKYDLPPLVRMTNTYILPDENGPSSKEEMATQIPKTKKGVYVKSCSGGWVDINEGIFMINGNLCYLIENGTITDKPIKGVMITGNIAKFTGSIKAVGNSQTMERTFTGYCVGPETPIITRDGLRPIREVREGDWVLTHKGRFRQVLRTFQRRVSEVIYRIKPQGGVPFYVTGNHEVLTAEARKVVQPAPHLSVFTSETLAFGLRGEAIYRASNSQTTDEVREFAWAPVEQLRPTGSKPNNDWRLYAVVPRLVGEDQARKAKGEGRKAKVSMTANARVARTGGFSANFDAYRLEVSGSQATRLAEVLGETTGTGRNCQRHINCGDYFLTRIQSIEQVPVEDFEVYNLHVEEDNSYVTPGMSLHNCGKNNQWVPVEGGGPLLYIEDAKLGGISPVPWSELVAEYDKQHREVLDGMRTEDGVYFPEVAEVRGKETPQAQVCLVTAVMSVEDEVSLILGKRDHAHFTAENGKLVRRGDKYE